MNVIGYLRVSTREQADSGLGLDAQRRAITDEATRRGWDVTWCVDEGYTARNMNRPGLTEALHLLKRREARVLVVAKLDRLSRSLPDFGATLDLARRQKWAVVALDLGVDMTTPSGKLVANILAAVAQWESETIGQRTADAMAEAKARGQRFGRERSIPPKVIKRILRERAKGASFVAIAQALDADSIPTPGGGVRWHESTVRRLVRSHEPEFHNCVFVED